MTETIVTISLVVLALSGLMLVLISVVAHMANAGEALGYITRARTTTDTWTCDCACDDGDANDAMLMARFQDIARDKELDDEVRKAASIALVKILMDYGPDDGDEEEETPDDPKPV